ncbi:MAG: Nif3-like dinuclear metal center hexameric protein [Gammaproteobacteria bacterium]
MTRLDDMVKYCDELLRVDEFQDYAPNGLQIEGKPDVSRIVSGVSANLALIESAIQHRADAVIVHHGYFWRGEDPRIIAMKKRRIELLMVHGISLLAYHLPLDAHPEIGNNASIAEVLGVSTSGNFGSGLQSGLAMYGELDVATKPEKLSALLQDKLSQAPLHLPGRASEIKSIGWCTGAAQDYLFDAAQLGLDAYISGEVSEQTTHIAREMGIHYFAAGHHATEQFGVRRLADRLSTHFKIDHIPVNIPNPV